MLYLIIKSIIGRKIMLGIYGFIIQVVLLANVAFAGNAIDAGITAIKKTIIGECECVESILDANILSEYEFDAD